jgi:large subunit ribosomal protein L4
MSKLPVRNSKGEQIGEHNMVDELLVYDKGTQAVHDVVTAYLAHQRAGSAATRTRAEVRGTGGKPWRQKGLGRARSGSRQSPVWRGGGVTFGPKPRTYGKKVPKKVGRLAFRRAFSERVAAGEVVVLDELSLEAPKTSEMAVLLKALNASRGALIVTAKSDRNLLLSARNIPKVEVALAAEVNTYQMLRYPVVVVTRDGMAVLEERLQAASAKEKSA